MAATLKQIEESHHIGGHVAVRIDDGVAHASLPRQIDDYVETLIGKELLHADAVCEIQLHKSVNRIGYARHGHGIAYGFLHDAGMRQTCILESGVVIRVDIVCPHHLMPHAEQGRDGGCADKSGSACYKYLHVVVNFCIDCLYPI